MVGFLLILVLIICLGVLYKALIVETFFEDGSDSVSPRGVNSKFRDAVSYTLSIGANHVSKGAERRDPDFSQLVGLMSTSKIETIKRNLEVMIEEQGSNDFIVIESTGSLAWDEFLNTHRPLLIGDKLLVDVKSDRSYKYDTFRFIPCYFAEDGAEVSYLHIGKDNPAYNMLDTIKITGAYVADYKWWRNGSFPPESHKILVFYERNDGGDDEPENNLPPGYIESVIFCLDQILRHSKERALKE